MYVSGATVFCLLPSWQCYGGGLQEIMPKIENLFFVSKEKETVLLFSKFVQ
jgi:hypothetical protein